MAGWQRWLSIGAGILLLIGVFLPSLFRRLQGRIPIAGSVPAFVRQALSRLMQRRSVPLLLVIGLLNGFLPCGFVYVALAAAATTGGSIEGAIFMAGFGLGTIPVMFTVSVLGRHIGAALRRRITRLAPAVTVVIAVIIILRGMNLGIPFVSPSAPAATEGHCH